MNSGPGASEPVLLAMRDGQFELDKRKVMNERLRMEGRRVENM